MNPAIEKSRSALRTLGIAVVATALGAGAALAGQCPADKIIAATNLPGAATAPSGVTDTVLGHIALADQAVRLPDHQLRLRRLVVQPGGVVPLHSHGDRPAIIYIVEGEIAEHANTCAVPILHRVGEVAMESVGLSHWWRNTGSRPVVLLSADLFHKEHDPKMM
jgi:quercetin dioxygenase-like cupin family protein